MINTHKSLSYKDFYPTTLNLLENIYIYNKAKSTTKQNAFWVALYILVGI